MVRAAEPVRLVINSPFLPGWRIFLDGRPVSPSIRSDSGYMEVRVPVGSHQVEAVFGKSGVRAAAEMVTLISVLPRGYLRFACWTAWDTRRARGSDANPPGRLPRRLERIGIALQLKPAEPRD